MTQAAKFVEGLVACALVLGAFVLGGLAGGASAAAQDALRLPTSAGDEPPMVSSISFRSYPEVNGTYERGETVEVAVDFTARVNVTGSPQLALIVGDQTRWATYSHNIIWTNKLSFRYTVQAVDRDTNGISIPADAIRLNGGSIRASPDGVIDAVLTHVGVPDKATHWVDGSRFTAPAVSSIAFENSPLDGDTYEFGERIRLAVAFNRTVVASTDVRLALAIGRQTRFADLSPRYDVPRCPPCGFYTQYFEYMVGTGDRDTDGISVPANALRLGDGGVIVAAVDRSVEAVLTHAGLAPDPSRKVDGGPSSAPKVGSISFRGYPLQGETYELGEDIELVVQFDKAVTVEGGPQVALTIGDATRLAAYFPGPQPSPALSFGYTVQPGDRDEDGVSISANALRLNSGAIRLVDGVTDAVLNHTAVGDDPNRKVRGSDTCLRIQPSDQEPSSSGPPTAGFTADATCVDGLYRERTGVEVSFTDTSTGEVATRHWDFGDGTTSSAERPRHAWAVPGFYRVSLTVSDGETSSIVSHDVLVEANDPAGTCKPDAETRCLQDSRYEVRAVWWWRDGRSGPARVAHAGTNDSALFWFFDLSNWEILVKVLDGCSTNGHFWVFGAATTDLGYRITVTDTVTGRARAYEHEGGPPAPAITDTTAFHACAR